MPFDITLNIDADKLDSISLAGDLRVSYRAGAGEPNLGYWNHQGRYEAGNESEMIADVCGAFTEWRDKRLVEVEIEASLKAALDPLCPCYVPPEEEPAIDPELEE